jgi:hypothetical protein
VTRTVSVVPPEVAVITVSGTSATPGRPRSAPVCTPAFSASAAHCRARSGLIVATSRLGSAGPGYIIVTGPLLITRPSA